MRKPTKALEMRDWKNTRAMWINALEKRTGKGLAYWKKRAAGFSPEDKPSLREWLRQQGVAGYAAQVVVMEHFGYPDFVVRSGADLIGAQYTDRPQLRAIYDRIVNVAQQFGPIVIQARKGYVSLLSPRKTFARIQATTKTRLDLGLRLMAAKPNGRLLPGKIHETMPVQLAFSTVGDFDQEALRWLRAAYDEAQTK